MTAKPGADLELAFWSTFAIKHVVYGVLAGGAIGWLLTDRAADKDWMKDLFQRLTSISLALLVTAAL